MTARVLVAGVGNVFFGDDGFGVEVAHRLSTAALPEGVQVMDVGIRGIHLAFELLDTPDLLVIVDLASRGDAPGTLYVLEPELDAPHAPVADAHGLQLTAVFDSLRALGGTLPKTRLVGCEPADVSERLGLSPVVEQAIEPALALVRRLIDDELSVAAGERAPATEANAWGS